MEHVFIPIVILIVVLNILWFWIKSILRKNGYESPWLANHFRDIPNIWRLAAKTEEGTRKAKYYLLAVLLPLGLIMFPVIFFSTVPSFVQCEVYKQFRESEWNGVVTRKFIDERNHRSKTVALKSGSETKNIHAFAADLNRNYDNISVGDSLVKNKGTNKVLLFNDGGQLTTLEIKYRYECEN